MPPSDRSAATPSLREDVSVIRTSLSVRDHVAHRALDRIEHRLSVLLLHARCEDDPDDSDETIEVNDGFGI